MSYLRYLSIIFSVLLLLLVNTCYSTSVAEDSVEYRGDSTLEKHFSDLNKKDWQLVLKDSGSKDWQQHWFLDGLKATVVNAEDGMTFSAGDSWKEDAHHAVLWTKQSFKGDVKIEYEFTPLDSEYRAVNILYVLATGKDQGPYKKDIAQWKNLRQVPAMKSYFNNMHTYHISYAAYTLTNDESGNDYIRARRYLPSLNHHFSDTRFGTSYEQTGFFKPGVKHQLVCIKKGKHLFLKVSNDTGSKIFYFDGSKQPSIDEGRIGLRHMYTRSSRYKNIRISELNVNLYMLRSDTKLKGWLF